MARLPGCLDLLPVLMLLLGNGIFGEDAERLMCDCTEQDCLSQGSAMCETTSSLGCYKEYYPQREPPVVMGCMRSLLLCDHYLPPSQYEKVWPYIACCFTDHCNRNLQPSPEYLERLANMTTQKTLTKEPVTPYTYTPEDLVVTSEPLYDSAENLLQNEEDPGSQSRPVFLLLIVLVVFFVLVVIASILVIIKIWFYRHQKPKEMNIWKVGQQNLPETANAQRTYLLTGNSSRNSSQQTSTNTLLESFDVP